MAFGSLVRFAIAGALVGLVSVSPARAAFTISSSSNGSAMAGANYASFDNLPLGSTGGADGAGVTVSFTGTGAAVQGSSGNNYAAPTLSGTNNMYFGANYNGPDNTTYLSTGTGTATINLNTQASYFGILWGSVDSYNTLMFYNGATLVGTVTGADVMANPNGSRSAGGTTYVNITSTLAFNRVVASSTSNSFEFDNVAFAVPEPSSFALCGIAGLIGLGVKQIRRKRTA